MENVYTLSAPVVRERDRNDELSLSLFAVIAIYIFSRKLANLENLIPSFRFFCVPVSRKLEAMIRVPAKTKEINLKFSRLREIIS